MVLRLSNLLKIIGVVVLALVVVVVSAAGVRKLASQKNDSNSDDQNSSSVEAAGPDAIRFNRPDVVKSLGIQVAKAEKAMQADRKQEKHGRQLILRGTLGPDTDRYVQVRPRFGGDVIEIGTTTEGSSTGPTQTRPITNGDTVWGPNDDKEGTLLAVVISKDLGLLKSNLLTALSQLKLDENTLEGLEEAYKKGAVPLQSIREGRQKVENDKVTVDAAKRTLRAYRLTDKEIDDLEQEISNIIAKRKKTDRPLTDKEKEALKEEEAKEWKRWARVEVRAPIDGTILEKNIALGQLVDSSASSTPLYIIGDLSRLSVWANLYEEDIPALLSLPRPIPWTVHLLSDPKAKPIHGNIREIRPIVDPTAHTVMIKAYLENPEGRYLAGQFITATVDLPASPNEAVVPTTALVEDGAESVIFVQPDANQPVYEMRHVKVLRRGKDRDGQEVVHLAWVWPELLTFLSCCPREGNAVTLAVAGLFQGSQNNKHNPARQFFKPEDELVVVSGAIELRAALKDLQESKSSQ